MITLSDYLGPYAQHPDVTEEVIARANAMLDKVNSLLMQAEDAGMVLEVNPSTGTYVSGHGNGGFRPQDSAVGAPKSKHKTGEAVDIYDPEGELDAWCARNVSALEEFGLYLEAAKATPTWTHMQSVPPGSGRRFFNP